MLSRIKLPKQERSTTSSLHVNTRYISGVHVEDTWNRLVRHVMLYGHDVELRKGKRREITCITAHVACSERTSAYAQEIVNPQGHPYSYTYGSLIMPHIPRVIQQLSENINTRKAVITLWDNKPGASAPCLIDISFRKEKYLNIFATFRTHNLSDAWKENVYALFVLLDYVCSRVGIQSGTVTTFSKSLTLSRDMAVFKETLILDDDYFVPYDKGVSFFNKYGKEVLNFEGSNAEQILTKIRESGITLSTSHAIWLGIQLGQMFK